MGAFSKVQTDINYPYSAPASEDGSSMPPRRVEKASRGFWFLYKEPYLSGKNFICQLIAGAGLRINVCLRETSVKKAKKVRSLSPSSGAPHRICAVADEESSRPQFD